MLLRPLLSVSLLLTLIAVTPFARAQEATSETDRSTLITQQRAFIAAFNGSPPLPRSTHAQRKAAADFLMAELHRRDLPAERRAYKHPNIHFSLDLLMPPMQGENIVSHIPATNQSDQYIILGAHYDTVKDSPGADDNASGIAVALSVATRLSQLETRNMHTLIVFFDQEEDDSPGSKTFAKSALADDLQIHSMHNIDMIGWDGDEDRTFELDASNPTLQAAYRTAAASQNIQLTEVTYNSSDHIPFRNLGIDVVCLGEEVLTGDRTPHYHKSTDTIDTLDFDALASGTLLIGDVFTALVTE